MKYAPFRIFFLLGLVVLPFVATAQNLTPYEIAPDATEYEIALGPEQRGTKSISVFFVSSGSVSTAVDVKALAPLGSKLTARGGLLRTGEAQAALASSNLIQPYRLRTIANTKREVPEAPFVVSDEYPQYGALHAWYHLQKDACSGGPSSRYVTEIKIDLSGIQPSEFDAPFPIRIAVKEFKFLGGKAASIKPASDGKYKGEPILLMQSVSYSGEYVNIVEWANGKIRSQRRIPVVKYVGYKGLGLSLARLRGQLNGGKATFELSNAGDIYGVCFNRTRTRQVANGYPAPN